MKKGLFCVLLTFLGTLSAFGQGIYFGPIAGISLLQSHVTYDQTVLNNGYSFNPTPNQVTTYSFSGGYKPWLQVGVFLEAELGKHFALQPSLVYMRNLSGDVHFNNIELPLLLKYNLTAGPVKVFPEVGSFINLKVSDNYAAVGIENTQGAMNAGLLLGGGLSIAAGRGIFIFDARYALGLVNTSKQNSLFFSNTYSSTSLMDDNYSSKTRAFIFSVGYGFQVRK